MAEEDAEAEDEEEGVGRGRGGGEGGGSSPPSIPPPFAPSRKMEEEDYFYSQPFTPSPGSERRTRKVTSTVEGVGRRWWIETPQLRFFSPGCTDADTLGRGRKLGGKKRSADDLRKAAADAAEKRLAVSQLPKKLPRTSVTAVASPAIAAPVPVAQSTSTAIIFCIN